MFAIQFTPAAQAALARAKAAPATLLPALAATLDLQNELTVGHIQKTKLSRRSATTLGVRTNRLRSSLRPRKTTIVGNQLISAIGTNVRYAGAHEFGFTGTVSRPATTVRPHRRKGRPVTAHTRRPHTARFKIKARAPIATGIKERIPNYSKALSTTILQTLTP